MRKIVYYMLLILLLLSVKINSQEIYQQTMIELKDVLDYNQSYLCQATTSIELLPGFDYNPTSSNEMKLGVDRFSIYPPSDGFYGGNDKDEDCVVGTIPGVLNVGTTGAATYSIDIQLPRALGSMIPKLAMVYNNQSANGLLGWSWDLLGLSSIERVGQTEYHDGQVTNVDFVNDKYVIDGQRLMSVGDNEYKTEIDNLDKIVSYNGNKRGPDYFVVWKNDGTIWEYGITEDSKVEPQGNGDVVLKWLLSKISDRNGNVITYTYRENNSIGETYIENIEYTSNDKANVNPAYKIVFKYNERKDASVGYVCGSMFSNTKILDKIEVLNNYSGKKIIEYSLGYDEPGYYNDNYYLHYRLNSIQLTVGGKKINPTRIIWNSKDKWATDNSCGYKKYELDKTIFNKASFVGDFNGDGFSDVLLVPYKVQNTYTSEIEGEIYLNNGDGSFIGTPFSKIGFNKNLDWIYVCDIDGNGIDDIVPFEMHYDNTGAFDMVRFSVLQMSNGKFLNKGVYAYKQAVLLLPANLLNKDNSGFLVIDAYNGNKNKSQARYVYMKNGDIVCEDIQDSNVINGKNVNCLAVDMTGDGISELLSLEENGYKVYTVKKSENLKLEFYCGGNTFTNKIYPFPNDYNGDGKVDLLYYDPAMFWNMVVSTGTGFAKPELCMKNNLLYNVRLNEKDRYRYSLKEMKKPVITIRTSDFDGDGTSDIGVFKNFGGNYYLEIGFSPYKDATLSSYVFSYSKRYYMPINYSHQTIQLGRFLSQENVSILSGLPRTPLNASKAYIVSLCPNSAYYSVEQLIDGMGNSTELTYGYLTCSKKNADFYTCNGNVKIYNVERKSIPILALKEIKTYNVNGEPVVKKYNYRNALVHSKGHGFLGFESVTIRSFVGNKLVNRQLQGYSLEPMDVNCIPMLTYDKLFQGENQLVKEHYFEYKKYSCTQNGKVLLPLLLQDREVVYDVDRNGVVLKNIITINAYESDIASEDSYDNMVWVKKTRKGYDNIKSLCPEKCPYMEEITMNYEDDIAQWIINRPKKIIKSVGNNSDDSIGEVQLFEYDSKNPMRIVEETKIPNLQADNNDPLTIVVGYKYDIVGNVIEQTMSSPSLQKDKVVKSEYGVNYKYRYKTKSIDEAGRSVICRYDDFGILTSTVDHNNLVTRIKKEPFGVKNVVTMPDGMETVEMLCWSEYNKYAPKNSSYYYWEKSVGKAESMVFYHKTGVELRNVTFDINGKAVIVDKMYDDYGNMKQVSYPYYENEDKVFVSNIYDKYNRLVERTYPNGLTVSCIYDGNSIQTEYSAPDIVKRYKKETYNVMGWMMSVVENEGDEIKYEYYSDGNLKFAQIGENRNTRISVTYDNCRNKASLYDPNYGLISYENDVLGNVKKLSTKQYIVEFEYDVLGRKMQRRETNLRNNKMSAVRWEYYPDYGYEGLLMRVVTSGGHQMEYFYDAKLRVSSTIESINGKKYKTSYTYDKANRISTISYPSGFDVLKKYSNSGYEKAICDAETQMILWKTNKTNSNGNVTEYQLGNGLKTYYTYNPYNCMIENIVTTKGDEVLQNLDYKYDGMCNLTRRCDMKDYNCEEFEYDSYNRLTKMLLNGTQNGKMTYYDNGNICDKEMNGVKVLYNTMYAVDKPNAITATKSDDKRMYERFGYIIEYSTFDNIVAINGSDRSLSIRYGYDNDRIFMQYNAGEYVKKKTYIGNCEYVEENGKTKVLTYLEGPMGVFAVHVNDGDETVNYINKDNIDSWNIITDKNGELLEKLSFDAWGNMRNPMAWNEDVKDESMLYDRGFTGHEHLLGFGLINMNGRLYDPLLSMMLSPDNNIQMPQSLQNFNRYSYCLNNPLKYYDPTGEFVESLAFGIAGGAANLVFNARNIDSFGEAALLFGVGFVKGFLVEYTMGQSWFLQVGVGAITEGVMSGVNRMVSVGDGGFNFSGDDWNSVKTAAHYGLGSGLVKSFMYTYMVEPTDTQYGESFFETSYHREFAHGLTSTAAHGVGCLFSGQSFLETMKFKDVGFDLKMLGLIAKRLLASYVNDIGFAEKALDKRARDMNESILNELLGEMPDTPEFEYRTELLGVLVEDSRIYVIGNIFQMIPGEVIETYPKPYMEEVITFPFSYSLFKTLFFNKE